MSRLADVKSTVREISDFEEELAKFRDTANETEAVVRQSVDRNKKPKVTLPCFDSGVPVLGSGRCQFWLESRVG